MKMNTPTYVSQSNGVEERIFVSQIILVNGRKNKMARHGDLLYNHDSAAKSPTFMKPSILDIEMHHAGND